MHFLKLSDKLGHNTSKETRVQSYVSKLPNSSSVRVQQPWSSDPRSTIKKATAHLPSTSKRLFLRIINTKQSTFPSASVCKNARADKAHLWTRFKLSNTLASYLIWRDIFTHADDSGGMTSGGTSSWMVNLSLL